MGRFVKSPPRNFNKALSAAIWSRGAAHDLSEVVWGQLRQILRASVPWVL